MIHLTILGQPVSWKNHGQPVQVKGRTVIVKPKNVAKWKRSALKQLKRQWGGRPAWPKDKPLNAAIISYLGNRRMIDASNLLQGPEDVLEEAGVLENDSCIQTHNGSDRLYDKENPRVEIYLWAYTPLPFQNEEPVEFQHGQTNYLRGFRWGDSFLREWVEGSSRNP